MSFQAVIAVYILVQLAITIVGFGWVIAELHRIRKRLD